MSEKVLITSALLYANAPLHFGHLAGAYLPADSFARFSRLKGKEVLYLSGSDEYGVAITLSAELAERSPREHVDKYHEINKALFKKLDFSFDIYARTTSPVHSEETTRFFNDLHKNGNISEKTTEQLYSEEDQQFLADRYVIGTCPRCGFDPARGDECPSCAASYEATDLKKPRSKMTGASLALKETKHCFLRFELFKEKLLEWLETKRGSWKANVLNFVQHYVENLKERAITRDLKWGIPVPLEGFEDKVFYVWFDAPIGYISAAKEWAEKMGKPDAWKDFWCDPDTKLVQFIGKDNIPFHAIFFPAMIMGQEMPYKLVDELPANEFFNLEGKQFSKSDNWMIDLDRFFTNFSSDQIRYSIAANAPETQDSEFTWKDFQMRCNTELLGKYGNLVNRVLTFSRKNLGPAVPNGVELSESSLAFIQSLKKLAIEISYSYEHYHLRKAASQIMELASLGNVFFDSEKPWKVIKEEGGEEKVKAILYACMECLKILALVSSPIIPQSAQKVWEMLGYDTQISEENWDQIITSRTEQGMALREPQILFKRVENDVIEHEIALLKEGAKKN